MKGKVLSLETVHEIGVKFDKEETSAKVLRIPNMWNDRLVKIVF